jgi:hypothetical protein
VGDAALGLLPDLGAGGLVVAQRVVRVAVLVGLPRPGDLPHQPVRDRVVGVGVLRVHRGGADDDPSAIGREHVALVLTDLVRADEDARVATKLGNQRETHTRVATGGFDDRATRSEKPCLLGLGHHPQRDAILHASAGIEVLDLREDGRGDAVRHIPESDQRGVADQLDYIVDIAHAESVAARNVMSDGPVRR